MKQFTFLLILFFIVSGVSAQKPLSLNDATLGQGSYLKPKMPEQVNWRDNQHFVMVMDSALFQYDILKKEQSKIISVAEFSNALQTVGFKATKSFPPFSFISASQIWFLLQKQLVIFNVGSRQVEQTIRYPEDAENMDFCAGNTTLAYTVKKQPVYCW